MLHLINIKSRKLKKKNDKCKFLKNLLKNLKNKYITNEKYIFKRKMLNDIKKLKNK